MKLARDEEILEACEVRLRSLQPVKRVYRRTRRHNRSQSDAELVLETDLGRLSYVYAIKRGLSLPRLDHLLVQLRLDASARPLLLTDYVSAQLADRLVEVGVNFVDLEGNTFIHWPGKLYIRVQGARHKRLSEAAAERLSQPSGLQVVYAFLVQPGSASMSYRDLAKTSGVALGTVARAVQELKQKGYLQQRGADKWFVTRKRDLLDLFVGGYTARLRPKLLIGRFQPSDRDLDRTFVRLKKGIETKGMDWALTGGFAADLLTHHFRGDQLGFFVPTWPVDLINRLKWLPSTDGPVTVLRQFSRLVIFTAKQRLRASVAHPLLVYAELVFQGRERELETAKLLYERYLSPLAHGD